MTHAPEAPEDLSPRLQLQSQGAEELAQVEVGISEIFPHKMNMIFFKVNFLKFPPNVSGHHLAQFVYSRTVGKTGEQLGGIGSHKFSASLAPLVKIFI